MLQRLTARSFYPRHPRGWRRHPEGDASRRNRVSIHATLAGGDIMGGKTSTESKRFYPRHPRGWRRRSAGSSHREPGRFYPRHPRGWRHYVLKYTAAPTKCFYPRHPRGWRPPQTEKEKHHEKVSIHATLAGGDGHSPQHPQQAEMFLSTPPSRVATQFCLFDSVEQCVSIHATLAGGDREGHGAGVEPFSFYPRHPRGWRHREQRA